jgi:hypothetical protein
MTLGWIAKELNMGVAGSLADLLRKTMTKICDYVGPTQDPLNYG